MSTPHDSRTLDLLERPLARSPGQRSRWLKSLALIVALGVGLRVAAILVAGAMGYHPVRGDAITYDGLAQSLAEGRGFLHQGRMDNVRPPLYPFVLSLVYRLFGHEPLAGAFLQALLDGVSIAFVAAITLWLTYSPPSALLAALLLALWPGAIFMDLTLYTEPLYTAILLLGTFALIRNETRPTLRWAAATGILWGLAGLTRQTALYFLPFYAVVAPLVLRDTNTRRAWARLMAVGVCLLTLLPWCIRDVVVNERLRWIEDHSGLNLWIGNYVPNQGRAIDREALADVYRRMKPTDVREVDRGLRQEALRNMRAQPLATAWLWVLKLERFLFVDMRPDHVWLRLLLSLLLLAGYAAALYGARRLPPESLPGLVSVAVVFGYVVLVHVVSYSQMRFAEPTRPLIMALAAHGLVEWWRERRAAPKAAVRDAA